MTRHTADGASRRAARADLLRWAPVARLIGAARESELFDPQGAAVTLARAPGRLDVMGGIADYSGAAVCEMPLAVAAAAAVQPRDDGLICCHSVQTGHTVNVPAHALASADAAAVCQLVDEAQSWARYLIGCAWWLGRHTGEVRPASILVDSDVPLGGGVSSSAAIEVATMSALAAAADVTLEPMALAAACQVVENRVVGAPCGVMDQVTAALGHERAMLELLCQPDGNGLPAQVVGDVAVPAGYAFIGVHSGVEHEVRGDPYTDTRVAAFMARRILSTLETPDLTRGHLANVDPQRFDRELAEALPAQITGQAFLEQYGETGDTVTTVQPSKTYTPRHAAMHHVLEAQRVRRFVALMRSAAQACATDRWPLVREAGELMIQSHASYRDHAHLGHPLTDRLVELVQELGPEQGFSGAKITGGGCGGTVAMLVRDEAEVMAQVHALRQRYTAETGRTTLLFCGTSPGAASLGPIQLDLQRESGATT